MNLITHCVLLVVLLLVQGFPVTLFAASSDKLRRMNEISRELAKERNKDILLYGKVVDFDGRPVAGAEVRMHVRVFGSQTPQGEFADVRATTAEDGRFLASGFGELITLDDILRDGYVYSYRYNRDRSRWSLRDLERSNASGYDQANPIVFRMRKLGSPAFVLTAPLPIVVKPGQAWLLDLYKQSYVKPENVLAEFSDWHADVRFSLKQTGENLNLIVEALDPDSGFVTARPEFAEDMVEAPEHGYSPWLVLPVGKGAHGRLDAYVKAEGGLFYGKLNISYETGRDGGFVRIRGRCWANMTGGRSLEFSDAIFSQYSRNLMETSAQPYKRPDLKAGRVVVPAMDGAQ